MWLNLESIDGIVFGLGVSNNDNLQEIKHKIQRKQGFPISSQFLSFNGNIIANDADLLSSGITDGSLLYLHIAAEDAPEILFKNLSAVKDSDNILNQFPLAAGASFQPSLAQVELQDSEFSVEDLLNAAEASTQPSPPQCPPLDDDEGLLSDGSLYHLHFAAEDPLEILFKNLAIVTDSAIVNQFPLDAGASSQPSPPQFELQDSEFSIEDLLNGAEPSTQPWSPTKCQQLVSEFFDVADASIQPLHQEVFIKIPAPFEAVNIETANNETILQLKLSIQEITKIPAGQIVIRDQYRVELQDHLTLLHCQISDNLELNVEFLAKDGIEFEEKLPLGMHDAVQGDDICYFDCSL